jgi:predicted transcriptional regulator
METLTVKIDKELKQTLLRYSSTKNESPSAIVSRALQEFLAFSQQQESELWFGMPATEYFALSEKEREALWDRAYQEELNKPQPKEREVSPDVVTPGQRGIETIRRGLREIRSRANTDD